MRHITLLILIITFFRFIPSAEASNEGVWIGRQFPPEQRQKLEVGTFEVKRKLCTITYDVTKKNNISDFRSQYRYISTSRTH